MSETGSGWRCELSLTSWVYGFGVSFVPFVEWYIGFGPLVIGWSSSGGAS